MTLAKARQTLKAYTANKLGHDDAAQVHEAIEALVKSWASKATHGRARRATLALELDDLADRCTPSMCSWVAQRLRELARRQRA